MIIVELYKLRILSNNLNFNVAHFCRVSIGNTMFVNHLFRCCAAAGVKIYEAENAKSLDELKNYLIKSCEHCKKAIEWIDIISNIGIYSLTLLNNIKDECTVIINEISNIDYGNITLFSIENETV